MFAPEINLSHCQKTWEDKPLYFVLGIIVLTCILGERKWKVLIAAILCRIYVYWIYRQQKGKGMKNRILQG